MKVTYELETYFIAFTLKYEISPTITFGIERHNLVGKISRMMLGDKSLMDAQWYAALHRAAKEVGANPHFFLDNFAAAYLDWLYAQAISKNNYSGA